MTTDTLSDENAQGPAAFIQSVAAQALNSAESLLERWLQNGKRQGREYKTGDRDDNPGESLSINIETGLWSDFATGDAGGDLVSLFAYLNGCRQLEAAKHIAGELGGNLTATPRPRRDPVPLKKAEEIERYYSNQPPTPSQLSRSELGGVPTQIWTYQDQLGRFVGAIARYQVPVWHYRDEDGQSLSEPRKAYCKEIRPWIPSKSRTEAQYPQKRNPDHAVWALGAMEKLRPLYNLPDLLANPEAAVVIVEGEKAADAAKELFPGCVVTTSAGGARAAKDTDWSPLECRNVLLWSDYDEPGRKYIGDVHELAQPATAHQINPEWLRNRLGGGELEEGYDAADAADALLDADEVTTALKEWREADAAYDGGTASPSEDEIAAALQFAKAFCDLPPAKKKDQRPELLQPEALRHLSLLQCSPDADHQREFGILEAYLGNFKRDLAKHIRVHSDRREGVLKSEIEARHERLRRSILRRYVVGDPGLMRRMDGSDNPDETIMGSGYLSGELDKDKHAGKPPYEVTSDGTFLNKTKNNEVQRIKLANFSAKIAEERTEDDGVETRHTYQIEANVKGRMIAGNVPAGQFNAMGWVPDVAGAGAILMPGQGTKDHLRCAIQILSDPVPKRRIYTHTGWLKTEDGFVYLHAGGAIGAIGSVTGIQTELIGDIARYELPAPPECEALVAVVRASLDLLKIAPDRVTFPLMGGVCHAALMAADYSLFLLGQTGVRKSEVVGRFQQFFGAGMDARHLPAAWSSTENALEMAAFLVKDAVLVIDDFKPEGTQADQAQMHKKAARVFRAQGNNSGRGRLRQDGTPRPSKPPRGMIVATGEELPKGHSVMARLVVIEIKPGDVDLARLTQAQKLGGDCVYAQAMAGYVRWVAVRYLEHCAEVKARAVELRDAIAGVCSHPRTPFNMGYLQAGFELWLRFAREIAALSAQEAQTLGERSWTVLRQLAGDQSAQQRNADPVERFRRLLAAAISSGKANLTRRDGGMPQDAARWGFRVTRQYKDPETGEIITECLPTNAPRVGFVDDTGIYLTPDAAFNAANEQGRGQDENLGVSIDSLQKQLHAAGVLASWDVRGAEGEPGYKRWNTVRKVYCGARAAFLHVPLTFFESEILGALHTGTGPNGPNGPIYPGNPETHIKSEAGQEITIKSNVVKLGPLGPLGPIHKGKAYNIFPKTLQVPPCQVGHTEWEDAETGGRFTCDITVSRREVEDV